MNIINRLKSNFLHRYQLLLVTSLLSLISACQPLAEDKKYKIQINSIAPSSGDMSGGYGITISGTGLSFIDHVEIGSNDCTNLVATGTTVMCNVPAGTAGITTLTVYGDANRQDSTSFTYINNAPTISSISPIAGPLSGGGLIRIYGDHFKSGTTVTLGGSACSGVTVISKNEINCILPTKAAGAYPIILTDTDARTITSTTNFTYRLAPTVTGISPNYGSYTGGTPVVVTGTGFITGSRVLIGSNYCSNTIIVSSTQITCTTVTNPVGTIDMTVTNIEGQFGSLTSAFTFAYIPSITQISPSVGALAGGTTVTVNGANFLNGATITVGGTPCSSVAYVSATQLRCITPTKVSGSYNLVVTNPNTYSATSATNYTYQAAPSVTGISPTAGALSGGTAVTITGTNFITGATVSLGGSNCGSVSVVGPTSITCITTSHAAGAVSATVTNSDTQSGTLAATYTYKAAPTITSISPIAGALAGSTNITITGTGFVTGATVDLGGSGCGSVTVVSATLITCITTAHAAGATTATVTNSDNQSGIRATAYTYLPAPTVTIISPNAGALAGGTTITITGTGFITGATVNLGGSSCGSVSVVSATSITCVTTAHVAGATTATVTNFDTQNGILGTAFTYQAAPTLTSITPNAGSLSGATNITITGTGFLTGATVSLGGSNCGSVSVVSATSITCITTAHAAGATTATVTNSDNQTSNLASAYTYRAAPTITSISPVGGNAIGGTTVTITGTGFISGAVVNLGGSSCGSLSLVSATSITCVTSAHAAGITTATITNSDSQTGSLSSAYTYLSAPTITNISPAAGPLAGGTTVTLTGTSFFTGATVTIGGVACTSINIMTSTSLTCITGAKTAGLVSAILTNIDSQTGTGTNLYSYQPAPTISSISPSYGPIGGNTSITISGTGFVTGANVLVGGNTCTGLIVVSGVTITCNTPVSLVSGPVAVSVRNSDSQSASIATGFLYLRPPDITAISPNRGPLAGGSTLTITGTDFFPSISVTVGGQTCTSVNVLSTTSVTCILPSNVLGTYDVVVTNSDGQTDTLTSSYTYQGPPTISSVSPSAGSIAGGSTLTISGTGFYTGSSVSIGSVNCGSVIIVSSTSLTCVTGAKSAGTYSVTVTNADTQSVSLAGSYSYQLAPTVTSVSPNAGALAGGTLVTITGTNFLAGAGVSISGTTCTGVTVVSPNSITCTTSSKAAGAYSITVTNSDNQSSSGSTYTYQAAPSVLSIFPNAGALAGGTLITISGSGFFSGMTVDINGSSCTLVTFVSSSTVRCTTPANIAGSYSINVTNPDLQSNSGSSYTYQGAPTVSAVSPNGGALAGGTSITITGTNFIPGAIVSIAGSACSSINVVNFTTINCMTIAKTAGTYSVSVTNSDTQTGSLASAFTHRAAPSITSISPNIGALGGSTSVTITGSGFVTGATVSIGGSNCGSLTVNSSTSISCTTSAHAAGSATVSVTNSDNQVGTLSSGFTYQAGPAVTSISPNSGPQAGGTSVTLTGTSFSTGMIISFGGSSCTSVNVTNSTTATCFTPGNSAGAIAVAVLNVDGQSGSTAAAYTYTALPVLQFQTGSSSPTPPNPDNYGSTTTNITHTFTLKNTGEGTSSMISTSITGTNAAAWVRGTDNCSGTTLAINGTCTIQMTFLGAFVTSGSYNAAIQATATSGGTSTNSVTGTRP